MFCFQYLQSGFAVTDLPQHLQAKLALRLAEIAQHKWKECELTNKHSQFGIEHLDAGAIKPASIATFSDVRKFVVFRYTGDNRPMIGMRVGNVFHLLWIEKDFGQVYDHG